MNEKKLELKITEWKYPFRQPAEEKTYEYSGPVFEYMTNTKVKKPVIGINGVRPKQNPLIVKRY